MFDISKIAKMAKIKLSEEEKEILENDMKEIVDFVSSIKDVEVKELDGFYIKVNELREDDVDEFKYKEDIIEAFPEKKDRFMKISKIINTDE